MRWEDRMEQLRQTEFIRTLRASLLEFLDEVLAFFGFLTALIAGLYYSSWWVFGGILAAAFLLGLFAHRILGQSKGKQ